MLRTKKGEQDKYLDSLFCKEDIISQKILKYSKKLNVDYMQLSAYEATILQFLCRAFKVKKAVEIGTLYGYSALQIARSLPKDGCLFSLDHHLERQNQAKVLMQDDPHSKKINFINGKALESLEKLQNKAPFDMVFIDADKNTYLEYLNWSYLNLKKGGVVVADNTFLFGALYDQGHLQQNLHTIKIMKEFNQRICRSRQFNGILIPTAEGLTVGIKN